MKSSNWNHNLQKTQETWKHVKSLLQDVLTKTQIVGISTRQTFCFFTIECKGKRQREMGKELLNERDLKPDIKQLKSVDLIRI